jgi:hypothetical protein
MIQNNFILFYHSQSPEAETLRGLKVEQQDSGEQRDCGND